MNNYWFKNIEFKIILVGCKINGGIVFYYLYINYGYGFVLGGVYFFGYD